MIRRAAIIAGVLAIGAVALADDEPVGQRPTTGVAERDPRTILTNAFADQRAVIDRAAAAVNDKLAIAGTTRADRVRAAYKLLRSDDDAAAIARRRAAVRWLLARDRAELDLLAEEAGRLLAARQRLDRDTARATEIGLPSGLRWPVKGTIARRFGPYRHDRSGATLTRRGLDLEVVDPTVDPTVDVVAPAAGTVRYAGPIRGLDAGVIIDHGEFLTVIGKLATPTVHAGDAVDQGGLLGHPARRRVYLEVRVEVGPGGTPMNPEAVLPPQP